MGNQLHIIEIIENSLDSMTGLEREIAHYFLNSTNIQEDLSSLQVTKQLHISQAALTRFAKKCGFKGYREFKVSPKRLLPGTTYHVVSCEIIHNFECRQKKS